MRKTVMILIRDCLVKPRLKAPVADDQVRFIDPFLR